MTRTRHPNTAPCQVDGCPDIIGREGRRGYCSAHYQRLKRFGDPLHTAGRDSRKPRIPKARLVYIKKCDVCDAMFTTTRPRTKRCETCRPISNPLYVPSSIPPRPCEDCGTELPEQQMGRPRLVCPPCRKKRQQLVKNRTRADANRRRRARKKGAFVARVHAASIYDRDGWRCQICGKTIKRGTRYPHPLSPSIDHIIPLALGGTHEPANVQAAHFICNSIKSDKGSDQLRLVG